MMSLKMLLVMMAKQGIGVCPVQNVDFDLIAASPLMLACWNSTRELMGK
jgi:hypothetical protein